VADHLRDRCFAASDVLEKMIEAANRAYLTS
jgi:hypothetical protein